MKLIMEEFRKRFSLPEEECRIYLLPSDIETLKWWSSKLDEEPDSVIDHGLPVSEHGFIKLEAMKKPGLVVYREDQITKLPVGRQIELVTGSGTFLSNSTVLLEWLAVTGKTEIRERFLRRKH